MVFFIVAIGDEQNAESKLKNRCPSFTNDNRPGKPEVHSIKVRSSTSNLHILKPFEIINCGVLLGG